MKSDKQLRLLLVLMLIAPWSIQAQEHSNDATKAASYGFVSPNTEENLSLHEAITQLNSAAESRLVSETHNVGCRARFTALVLRSVGNWSDGAEHSTLFKTKADESTIRYAVASLGRFAHQKAVLYFREHKGGGSRLHIFYPRTRKLFALARILDQAGIAFRTLVPLKHRTLVYVVDLRDELGERIPVAARKMKASVRTLKGFANFLGDSEDRQKAQVLFESEIKSFESRHPPPRKCAPASR